MRPTNKGSLQLKTPAFYAYGRRAVTTGDECGPITTIGFPSLNNFTSFRRIGECFWTRPEGLQKRLPPFSGVISRQLTL